MRQQKCEIVPVDPIQPLSYATPVARHPLWSVAHLLLLAASTAIVARAIWINYRHEEIVAAAVAQAHLDDQRKIVRDYVAEARECIADGRYTRALVALDKILAVDPSNDYANGIKQLVEDYAAIKVNLEYARRSNPPSTAPVNANSRIPYMDILPSAGDWPDVETLRSLSNADPATKH